MKAATFEVIWLAGIESIRCLACRRVSFNPNDVAQRYCGYCHVFHEDLTPRRMVLDAGRPHDRP